MDNFLLIPLYHAEFACCLDNNSGYDKLRLSVYLNRKREVNAMTKMISFIMALVFTLTFGLAFAYNGTSDMGTGETNGSGTGGLNGTGTGGSDTLNGMGTGGTGTMNGLGTGGTGTIDDMGPGGAETDTEDATGSGA
jgi:hypothetical protein